MADNIDKALNGLGLKTDSLPNDWMITLVNPKNGEPAQNMTVARFIELLTDKMPVVTQNNKGVMAYGSLGVVQGAINPNKIIKLYNNQSRFNGIIFVNDRSRSFALSVIHNWGNLRVTNITGDKNADIKIKRKDYNLYLYAGITTDDFEVSGIATKGTLSLAIEDYDESAGLVDVL